jgi:hypothetical protein
VNDCKHDNWTSPAGNLAGTGHCLDCGRDVWVSDLFNRLRERMLEAIKEAKA